MFHTAIYLSVVTPEPPAATPMESGTPRKFNQAPGLFLCADPKTFVLTAHALVRPHAREYNLEDGSIFPIQRKKATKNGRG